MQFDGHIGNMLITT